MENKRRHKEVEKRIQRKGEEKSEKVKAGGSHAGSIG